jgi:hypothetical protein
MASSYDIDQAAIEQAMTPARVVQLTNDDGGDTVDTVNLDAAIDETEGEFHLKAGKHFVTPVRTSNGSIPEGLRGILIELVKWRLMLRRPEMLKNDADEGAFWKGRRKELLDWMENLAPNSIPGAVLATPTGATKLGRAKVVSDTPRFTRARMKGFF